MRSSVTARDAQRERAFPTVVRAPARAGAVDLKALLRRDAESVRARLLVDGALLFRGWSVRTAEDLASLQLELGASMRYVGGDSPRTKLLSEADVYTSTEASRSVELPLHNELSYLDVQPSRLWFACVTPATRGGATTIADGRAVLAAIDADLRERFERLGVIYRFGFRGPGRSLAAIDHLAKANKSWMEAFETEDRHVVEEHCRRMHARFEWTEAGHLVLQTRRPATMRHPVTGEHVWFNQVHMFHFSERFLGHTRHVLARGFFAATGFVPPDACFGDGSPFTDEVIDRVFDALDANAVPVAWEAGDVLLLDNVLAMHGREAFRGNRKILVAMNA
jgi:alpha-ketoglutarate-dependent taurine dioxygenase